MGDLHYRFKMDNMKEAELEDSMSFTGLSFDNISINVHMASIIRFFVK